MTTDYISLFIAAVFSYLTYMACDVVYKSHQKNFK